MDKNHNFMDLTLVRFHKKLLFQPSSNTDIICSIISFGFVYMCCFRKIGSAMRGPKKGFFAGSAKRMSWINNCYIIMKGWFFW